jgi:cation diffusion facilitator CzcD-associated flavoprotein CzcO
LTDIDTEVPGGAGPDEREHLDVLIVGAGLSGIGAAHHVATGSPWASWAIFEARDAIGGTWDLFRFPGIRSDSDMFTLGYPFRPWTGEKAIADGDSIREYIEDTAAAEGIDEHIRFRHRIVSADWSSDEARWHVVAERTVDAADPSSGEAETSVEQVELTCGFLFSCSGYYRYDRGYLPEFAGMDRFAGTIVHPQHWPEDLDHAGKRVVVIGSGATAVTLIPALAKTAAHVTMLQRSPTYIASMPARSPLAKLGQRAKSPWVGSVLRWALALGTQASFHLSRRRPELMKRLLRKGVEQRLPEGYDVDTHFTPRYNPWDQRLCIVPDGDLFRAISDGTASVVTDQVDTFTETGVQLLSGEVLEADVIVTATGLELLFLGGIELSIDGEKVDVADRLTYKGMMLDGVPNLACAIGYVNASWTLKADLTSEYVTRLLNRMHETGYRQVAPVNRDPSVTAAPLLDLTSGYVQRSVDRFPKQGTRFPWQVHQSYLKDYRAMKRSRIDDGVMRFTNREPSPAASTGAAGAGTGTAGRAAS